MKFWKDQGLATKTVG